jgi:hypothetical protein
MIDARMVGTTLEVTLPRTLVLDNRLALVQAVNAALAPGVTRVRLDASALRRTDAAGLGALARIVRLSVDATSAFPELVHADAVLLETMRAVRLLHLFERGPDPGTHSPGIEEMP